MPLLSAVLLLALTWDDVGDWFAEHGVPIMFALVLALLGALFVRHTVVIVLRPAVARQMVDRPQVEIDRRVDTLGAVVIWCANLLFALLALFTILSELGVDIRPILAGLGIAGVAVGLGAQSLVRDGLNGMFILGENQYAVGDVVTIAGQTGTVEDMSLRRTLLRDLDGIEYSIPNSAVVVTANFTRGAPRVRVTVPVALASDMAKVRSVANAVGNELAADPQYSGRVLVAPAYVRIDSIDANGAAVQVNGTVSAGSQWEIAGVLRGRLLEAFQREGIKTPWG